MIERREVEHRLVRACMTLRALPDREASFQVVKSLWPVTADDPDVAYGYQEATMPRFKPSPRDVSDYLIALEWVRGIPRREFRFMWWRSLGFSFGRMGDMINRSREIARQRYTDVLDHAWYTANSVKADKRQQYLDRVARLAVWRANHPKNPKPRPQFRTGRILWAAASHSTS